MREVATVLLLWLAVMAYATPQAPSSQSTSGSPGQRARYVVYYQRPNSEATTRQYSRQGTGHFTRPRPSSESDDERQQLNYASPVDATRFQSYEGIRGGPQYQQIAVERPEYVQQQQHGPPPPPPPPSRTRHYGPPSPSHAGGAPEHHQQQYVRIPSHLSGGGVEGSEDLAALFQRPGAEQQLAYLGQGGEGHRLQSSRSPTRYRFVHEDDSRPSSRPSSSSSSSGGQQGGHSSFRPPVFPIEEGGRFPSGLGGHQESFGGSRGTSLRLQIPEESTGSGRHNFDSRFLGGGGHFGGSGVSPFGAGATQQFEDSFGGAGTHFGGGFGGNFGSGAGAGNFGGGLGGSEAALGGRGGAGGTRYGSSRYNIFGSEATRSQQFRDPDEFTASSSSPSESEIGTDMLLELLKLRESADESQITPQISSRSQRRFVFVRQ